MIINYIATYIVDVIALVFLLVLLYNDNFLSRNRKMSFSYAIIITIIIILAEAGTRVVTGRNSNLRSLNILFNIIGFSLTPTIPITLIAIFDVKIIQTHKVFLLPTILNFIAAFLSPCFCLIFCVDANNYYLRGRFFPLFVIVYIINIILLLTMTFYIGKKYFYPIRWKMSSLSIFTLLGTFTQILIPSIYASWHCVVFSLILFYILLVEFESSFDVLTKLYNRAAFEKASANLKGKKKFSLIIMDVNNFKKINDTLGHEYGDTVLKDIAEIIRATFNNNSSCYRIGGDELCIICRYTNQDKIVSLLKEFTNNILKKRQKDINLPMVAYGYSIFYGDKFLDFKELFREADEQMYRYKYIQKHKDIDKL